MTTFEISIHALREEGDAPSGRNTPDTPNFYPRPPRGGRRPPLQSIPRNTRFLSTPSARRATRSFDLSQPIIRISIHALREEGDRLRPRSCVVFSHISIHALREEGDFSSSQYLTRVGDFYPRPPRGGRRTNQAICQLGYQFLSTPSARRATPSARSSKWAKLFLSTPSARRATWPWTVFVALPADFYPRPPRGGRRTARCSK